MEDRLEISNSKVKTIGFIILGALFIVSGVNNSFLGFIYLSKTLSYIFLGIGSIVLIGGIAALLLLKGPRVILTKEGLIYNPKTNGFVKWTEIEGVTDYC